MCKRRTSTDVLFRYHKIRLNLNQTECPTHTTNIKNQKISILASLGTSLFVLEWLPVSDSGKN